MNMEIQKRKFRNHVANFTDHGNIKILDFKAPNTSDYRIRFLFEEDYCRLHISGDLGELSATNYNNMTYEGFGDFVNNTPYFKTKIDCMSREMYYYDTDQARNDLMSYIKDNELERRVRSEVDDWYADEDDEYIEEFISEVLDDYDENRGIGTNGYRRLYDVFDDVWEFAGDIGRKDTGIIELYMLAFKLAQEQITKGGTQ